MSGRLDELLNALGDMPNLSIAPDWIDAAKEEISKLRADKEILRGNAAQLTHALDVEIAKQVSINLVTAAIGKKGNEFIEVIKNNKGRIGKLAIIDAIEFHDGRYIETHQDYLDMMRDYAESLDIGAGNDITN